LAEVSCRVVSDDSRGEHPYGQRRMVHPPWPINAHEASMAPDMRMDICWEEPGVTAKRTARRMFPQREVTSGGSTGDQLFSASSKRRSTPPVTDLAPAPTTAKRRSVDWERLQSKDRAREETDPGGRRHLQPPTGYLSGPSSEVIRTDCMPAGRRHCSATRAAPTPARGSSLPAQRRHLKVQDHMVGGFVRKDATPEESGTFLVEGPRSSRNYGSCAMAAVLGSFSEASVRTQGGSARRSTSSSVPRDNLMGANLRGEGLQEPERPMPLPKPAKRPLTAEDNLLGGTLRQDGPDSSGRPSTPGPRGGRQASLLGGRFRGGAFSAPTTPRSAVVGARASSTPAAQRSRQSFFDQVVDDAAPMPCEGAVRHLWV